MANNYGQMATNSLTTQEPKKQTLSVVLKSSAYQQLINNTLQDKTRALNFVANLMTAISQNDALQACTPKTVLSCGLMAETLKLSLHSAFGQAYLIPFNKKDKQGNIIETNCTFQIGYTGYIQLAQRSGLYKKINVKEVKEGELVLIDNFNEEITIAEIQDEDIRIKTPTIGYYAFFELSNGFRKMLYWSISKMENHATTYSQAYRSDKKYKSSNSFWTQDFDSMGCKTLIRQLVRKWGPMSVEMEKAYKADMAVIKDNEEFEYVDNAEEPSITPNVEIVDRPQTASAINDDTFSKFVKDAKPNPFE